MCQRRAWLGITSHASNHQAGAEKVLPNAESRRAQIFLALLSVAVAFATLAARFSQLLMKSSHAPSPRVVVVLEPVQPDDLRLLRKLLRRRRRATGPLHLGLHRHQVPVIAVPGADDVMLNYQSLAFHDILYVRQTLGRRCAPEFEDWLQWMGLADADGRLLEKAASGAIGPAIALIEAMEA